MHEAALPRARSHGVLVVVAHESVAEMVQVLDVLEEKPRTKAIALAKQLSAPRYATPDGSTSIAGRVDGHDARSRIPTPEKFVADFHGPSTADIDHTSTMYREARSSSCPAGLLSRDA